MAKSEPDAYEPSLALVLSNFGILYYTAKDYAKCEPLYQESYGIYQRLAQKEPSVYNAKLALVKFNLGGMDYNTGKILESVTLWIESYELLQQEAQRGPLSYKDEIGSIQYNLETLAPWLKSEARDFRDNGQFQESKGYFQKALDIYRLLAKEDPKTYDPEIAGTLNGLGILYINNKQFKECETAFRESLEIYQRLSKTDPGTYQSEVIRMTDNFGALAYRIKEKAQQDRKEQRYAEAETLVQQAIGIYRDLAKSNPEKNLPKLVSTLGSYSYYCLFNHHWTASEQAAREALTLDPSQHWIYSNLAAALLFQGQYKEAEALYLQYKDELKKSFLGDFDDFESAGIISEAHQAEVERIKQLLNQ